MSKINFVGDLSKADVQVLIKLMKNSNSILEFGVGGSTQLFAQFTKPGTKIVSLDTDLEWIERTKNNISRFKSFTNEVIFHYYYHVAIDEKFDLIFDDGVDHSRLEFALKNWCNLSFGGIMAFHDTRRLGDVSNVLKVVHDNYLEVAEVQMNVNNSNISYIKKKISEPWVNWNHVEGKELWQTGVVDPPEGWPNL